MKKSIKVLLAVLMVFISFTTLSGCAKANIYKKFNNNGSTLTKAHVYEEVSYKKLYKLVDATAEKEGEYIYVFFGTPTDSSSSRAIAIFNEQAQQYEIDTVYWLDSDLSSKKLNKIESRLGINDIDTVPALWSFTGGKLAFDSSSSKCSKDGDTSYTNTQLAEKCFKNLLSI